MEAVVDGNLHGSYPMDDIYKVNYEYKHIISMNYKDQIKNFKLYKSIKYKIKKVL